MIDSFFRRIVDHPVVTIALVLAISIGFAVFIPQLTTDTDFTNYLDPSDKAVAASRQAQERYGSQSLFMVAVENTDGIFNLDTLTKIDNMRSEFEQIVGVDAVSGPINTQIITATESALAVGPASPQNLVPETEQELAAYKKRVMASDSIRNYIISADGQAAVISIKLHGDANSTEVAQHVVDIVNEHRGGPDKIYISGLPYMNLILTESMGSDLRILLPLVILVIVVVLYLSFWSVRGVVLPLVVVVLSTIWTLGLMAIFSIPLTIISFILPVILMAIGIAYCIHVLNKYYEAIAAGKDRRQAAIAAGKDMTSPVVMTGMTTAAGFFSLLNSFLIPQRQFGVFTGFGVLIAMLLALVVIPAVLALLKSPQKTRYETKRRIVDRILTKLGRTVGRYRRSIVVLSLVVFVVFAAGLPMIRVETSQTEFLGSEHPLVQAIDVMDRHFSGSDQVMIEIDTNKSNGLKDPDVLQQIVDLEDFLRVNGVDKTISIAGLVREMQQKIHGDDPEYYYIPEEPEKINDLLFLFTLQGGNLGSIALADFSAGEVMGIYSSDGSSQMIDLQEKIDSYLDQHFGGSVSAQMVGSTRLAASMFGRITSSQITSLVTSVVAAGLVVSLLMGSVFAGLISLIPLVLTVAINFGVMAYSNTPLDMATLMVSSIAIGIGIDYAIHFISRFRREYQANSNSMIALVTTTRTTGQGIAYNALALALGFAVLLFSSFKGTNNFGLLISMTMIISALSAFIVVGAILTILKPGFLVRSFWSRRNK